MRLRMASRRKMAAAASRRQTSSWRICDRPRCTRPRRGFATREELSGSSPAPRLLIALHHLVLQRLPDLAMQFVEGALKLDLADIARTRQRHFPVADNACGGPGRHDDDTIGERDRLFEIVGDEQHGLAVRAPQI